MKNKYTIKQILTTNQAWWNFYQKYKDSIRPAIQKAIVKLLCCRDIVRGFLEYHCSNPDCSHIKRLNFTCKSKACSSCGKKATELWIQKQNNILPDTSWQHIVFTMPSELWDFFWLNRALLSPISKLAADSIIAIARKKNITPGIFTALHTFGRSLTRNVHVHLSVTTGGLSHDYSQWKNLFFQQGSLMRLWRYKIISLFRKAYRNFTLCIPESIQRQLNHAFTFNHFLDYLYKKCWIVHCSKPSSDHKINVSYLARYTKRPPIAESKLRHYDGQEVVFTYLDHTTNTYRKLRLSIEEFIRRFIQHIPDEGFRMIRYYGFLAHRVRCKLLPIVHSLVGHSHKAEQATLRYADLIQKSFGFNPLSCILCLQPLVLVSIKVGLNINQLLSFHRELVLLKKISG